MRVAPGAADLPGDLGGRFLVLVRGAADTAAALAGLDAARGELAGLADAVLSAVVLSPVGPLLRVSSLVADEEVMQTVPALVAAALERHGVDDADLELVEPIGELDRLDTAASAVVLRVFPAPAGADGVLPPQWLEVAADWVLGDATADEEIGVRLLGASFRVPARDAPATLHAALGARAWCDLVHGRFEQRLRSASLTFGHAPHLALAAGGPGCDTTQLLARMELLQEVARDLGGAVYSCIDLEETFGAVGLGVPGTTWPARGGASPNGVVAQVGDVVVPDAFPFQILGPGHLDRLRERGHGEITGVPLEDGRVEVALGDPVDWLPRFETRDDVADEACTALADLLVTDAELADLVQQRPELDAGRTRSVATGGPDLTHVTLEAVPHPRRGLHLTLLELASWLGHEHHSDVPRGVSPVLAAYARWYASGLDHAERQELKPYAARLIGTRAPGVAPGPWRGLGRVEDARAWRAVDWLAREQAAAWLEAAGHTRVAADLRKVRRRTDGAHHDRQLRLLDGALVELLAAGSSDADDAAWDDWERASEVSAWVAASEAAWTGIPDAVASAVELRALEHARSGAPAPGRRAPKGAIAADLRAAAVAAAAEEGWRLAGEAAAMAVDARSTDPDAMDDVASVPLATAWDRAIRGAAARGGADRDAVEVEVEEAEAAARAVLADLVDGGDPPPGCLEIARRAAEASRGGATWRTVRELTRGVVGEGAWAAAQGASTEALDRVIHRAPEVVDRAVLVALAREVSGLAARRAIHSGEEAAVATALEELRPAALELLEGLLAVRATSGRYGRSASAAR